jgi:hypothetical protein
VQRVIIALVILNAVTLGLETVPQAVAFAGPGLLALDRILLGVFVVELTLKIYSQRVRFLRSGWNVFDFVVIAMACVPNAGPFAVFRALRVLRILRVVSAIPRMRLLVESLARSLPGIGSIGLLLAIFFYVDHDAGGLGRYRARRDGSSPGRVAVLRRVHSRLDVHGAEPVRSGHRQVDGGDRRCKRARCRREHRRAKSRACGITPSPAEAPR